MQNSKESILISVNTVAVKITLKSITHEELSKFYVHLSVL